MAHHCSPNAALNADALGHSCSRCWMKRQCAASIDRWRPMTAINNLRALAKGRVGARREGREIIRRHIVDLAALGRGCASRRGVGSYRGELSGPGTQPGGGGLPPGASFRDPELSLAAVAYRQGHLAAVSAASVREDGNIVHCSRERVASATGFHAADRDARPRLPNFRRRLTGRLFRYFRLPLKTGLPKQIFGTRKQDPSAGPVRYFTRAPRRCAYRANRWRITAGALQGGRREMFMRARLRPAQHDGTKRPPSATASTTPERARPISPPHRGRATCRSATLLAGYGSQRAARTPWLWRRDRDRSQRQAAR
jgi:hypothetical protein